MDSRLIALSHLALDLEVPAAGWRAYLADRGVAVVVDDLGRPSITRGAARELITEHQRQHRENEARKARVREEAEARAIAADQQFRAQLNTGIPWYEIPAGVTAAEMWAQQEKDSRPKRRTVLEDALAGDGSLIYHPLQDES
jgi:ParB-like chromosome segregation protein Spo0J